eukprot:TRINITY_DN2280_c0_g1_i6.p1 TRINITY_DN2280_c0_g1~~TRINITY_DN2280_c0_g1_i6.p1  ORF type:complete len:152 (+),score=10.45 TRINITY_DN2280_c0_g1_i6:569-1024(+)
MRELRVKVSLVTNGGETLMLKRVLIPLHFTSTAQVGDGKVAVSFYPSYACLAVGTGLLVIIAYVEARFAKCMKVCTAEKEEGYESVNGVITEDNKLIIKNLFDDNKEAPSRVPITIRFQQKPACNLPKYINIVVKESYRNNTLETAYVAKK